MLKEGMEAGYLKDCAKVLADPKILTNPTKNLTTEQVVTV
jgi:hypothetical protein